MATRKINPTLKSNVKSISNAVSKSKTGKKVAEQTNDARDTTRELWLASIGAAARVRAQGEQLVGKVLSGGMEFRKDASKLVSTVTGDVQEQANGFLAQVKGATAANLNWVGGKVEASMGKVLGRLGVPSKVEVQELSRRVSDLQKQVKAIKKAA